MSISAGLIQRDELPGLLELYGYFHPEDPILQSTPQLQWQWEQIFNNTAYRYVVSRIDGKLVSTCTLVLVQNLSRSGRPYGLIENVVTHPEYRLQGHGTAVLRHALELAWEHGCYKVMLMTGSKSESTLKFYENAGFVSGEKTGFVARPK